MSASASEKSSISTSWMWVASPHSWLLLVVCKLKNLRREWAVQPISVTPSRRKRRRPTYHCARARRRGLGRWCKAVRLVFCRISDDTRARGWASNSVPMATMSVPSRSSSRLVASTVEASLRYYQLPPDQNHIANFHHRSLRK
jgi:hypothetical protein